MPQLNNFNFGNVGLLKSCWNNDICSHIFIMKQASTSKWLMKNIDDFELKRPRHKGGMEIPSALECTQGQ
jgi:hypothetical protein